MKSLVKVFALLAILSLAFAGAAVAADYGFALQGQTSGYSQFQSGPGVQTSGAAGIQTYAVNVKDGNVISGITATNGYGGAQTGFTGFFGGFQAGSGSGLQGGVVYVK